ncbi:bifunctional diaminohydroxyphosphoribosylaminopyrimidine deaminase/5-amino-6-(5-phosphoribosylamino)uracil reductase RibD [candidate division KSB1 bacterium]|nr:bifunctional diaminohydroxyphosphoribosylaminopyrimidine deaminase/5-amino-6-(5-phosphoribosylamino)uracil reductase RibD [candidate division KSB1 bacterium]
MTDEELIKKTLKLAEKGRGKVSPNPLVGAVITKNNEIIAEGFHREFGGVHAEVAALDSARQDVSGGTLYVNLEPCSHRGKQPACVERIKNSGIKRVVVGTPDPNPLVDGKGIALLRKEGLEVKVGVLEEACGNLNEAFFKYVQTNRPLITLKIAQTLDGKIAAAGGSSKWITSGKSRRLVHKMRSQNDAVLVGIGTVLKDNPRLTVRLVKGPNPKRIVLDSTLKIPLNSNFLTKPLVEKTIIATTSGASKEKIRSIKELGANVWTIKNDSKSRVDLSELCKKMGIEGITSVFVEGGSQIFSAFLQEQLADKIAIFIAPKIFGEGLSAVHFNGIHSLNASIKLSDFEKRKIGDDVLLTGRLQK